MSCKRCSKCFCRAQLITDLNTVIEKLSSKLNNAITRIAVLERDLPVPLESSKTEISAQENLPQQQPDITEATKEDAGGDWTEVCRRRPRRRHTEKLRFLTEAFEKEYQLGAVWFLKNQEAILETARWRKPDRNIRPGQVVMLRQRLGMPMLSQLHKDTFENRRTRMEADGPILGLKASECYADPIVWKGHHSSTVEPKISREVFDMVKEEHGKSHPVQGLERSCAMMPVPEEEKRLISEEGSFSYLKARNKHAPDERYHFPVCSSMEYNWRPKEINIPPYPDRFGRVACLTSVFAVTNGEYPDPSHYKQPFDSPNKCPL